MSHLKRVQLETLIGFVSYYTFSDGFFIDIMNAMQLIKNKYLTTLLIKLQ